MCVRACVRACAHTERAKVFFLIVHTDLSVPPAMVCMDMSMDKCMDMYMNACMARAMKAAVSPKPQQKPSAMTGGSSDGSYDLQL